jgi:hypothetical protein
MIKKLRAKQNALKEKFCQTPRIFDEAEWNQLHQEYVNAGLTNNALSVADRIEGYKYILRNEHTPMTPALEHAEPWQLRKDMA